MQNPRSVVVVFKSNGLGHTQAQDLKEKLVASFLGLIVDADTLPQAICFYTDGVKLACEGSPVLEALQALESCGTTCLNYFGLMDEVRVGIPGGMGDIITAMWSADSVLMV